MHHALLKLVRLQLKGWVRRQFTGGSLRRTVFVIVGRAIPGALGSDPTLIVLTPAPGIVKSIVSLAPKVPGA